MKKMLRWCSSLLLMTLIMAAMLLLPVKAAAVPVLTPKALPWSLRAPWNMRSFSPLPMAKLCRKRIWAW